MRTTLVLEDSIFEKAKRYAFETDTTLSDLASLALKSFLMREACQTPKKKKKVTLSTYGTPGGNFLTLQEIKSGSCDFAWIFFARVAHLDDFSVTRQGVVVEAQLSIKRKDLTVFGHDEWVDFNHHAVRFCEKAIEIEEEFAGCGKLFSGKSQATREMASLVWL